MFCLMDVSGSMTEAMKDLAKRFFLLLHVFLTRRYKQVDIVFIRHTSNAQEVDEDTFFHSRETGGTIVSTALEEMLQGGARALQPRQLEHLRRAGLGRRQLHRGQRPLQPVAGRRDPAARRSTSPISRSAPRRRCATASPRRPPTSGAPTARSPSSTGTSPCARSRTRRRYSRSSTSSSPSSGSTPDAGRRRCPDAGPASLRGTGMGFRQAAPRLRRHRGDRARRDGPRHLSQPDRGDHLRADARRLRLDRPAADVPALELRQALRPRGGALPPRPSGPRLRDRHQFEPLHQLHHGGELHDDADAGHRARRLRPQPLLQEQLPLPPVDRRRPASSTISPSRATS